MPLQVRLTRPGARWRLKLSGSFLMWPERPISANSDYGRSLRARRAALELLGEMLKYKRSLRLYLDVCTHCGACADKCHSFLGTKDPYNMPVARVDLVRRVYNKVFAPGRFLYRLWNRAGTWIRRPSISGISTSTSAISAAAAPYFARRALTRPR